MAIDAQGNFVVAWFSTSRPNISIQRFNAQGVPQGDSISFNTRVYNYNLNVWPTVAMDAQGNFTVGYYNRIQRFAANGTPLGSPFSYLASTRLDYFSYNSPGLAYTPTGDLLVSWYGIGISDGINGIYVRRFNTQGVAQGNELLVGKTFVSNLSLSNLSLMVATDSTGGFVVAWQYASFFGDIQPNVYARRYDAVGNPLGDSFKVNTDSPGEPYHYSTPIIPSIAFDGRNNFIITWNGLQTDTPYYNKVSSIPNPFYSPFFDDPLSSRYGILARGFYADGTPMGDQFHVNTQNYGKQTTPSVAADAAGNVMIVWSTPGIQAQRFQMPAPPVVDLNGPAAGLDDSRTYVLTGGPAPIGDPHQLLVSDATSAVLASASVSIAGGLPGDVLTADITGTNLTAAYANGVLTLTGPDTPAHFQQVLRGVRFDTTASRPNGAHITIDVVVNDGKYDSATAHETLVVRVPAVIVDRKIFYNHSALDGNNRAANAGDDGAIATDKTALLPGQMATFANYTSYSRGINGIMLDIAGGHGAISAADFTFKVGNDNSPDTWSNAPAPLELIVRAGAGVGGADRVEITWADGDIKNQWLQVHLAANDHTGLAHGDTFYFGNAIGETGNSTTDAKVTRIDMLRTVSHFTHDDHRGHRPSNYDPTYDFNHDLTVNAKDLLIVLGQLGHFHRPLKLILAPAAAPEAPINSALAAASASIAGPQVGNLQDIAFGLAALNGKNTHGDSTDRRAEAPITTAVVSDPVARGAEAKSSLNPQAVAAVFALPDASHDSSSPSATKDTQQSSLDVKDQIGKKLK